jgi:hypothetical protein
MKRIPIKAARAFAQKFSLSHVIIFAKEISAPPNSRWRTHVITYGETTEAAGEAADMGNILKQRMGWPEHLCWEQPSRVRQLQARVKELEAKLSANI